MQYGICHLSAVPLRKEAADPSEMINQVLFGECFEILEQQAMWSFIRLAHDDYEGWIDNKQYLQCSPGFYRGALKKPLSYSSDMVEMVAQANSQLVFPIFPGSPLPFYQQKQLKISEHAYEFSGSICAQKSPRTEIVNFASLYLHAPYLWGGRTPFGIDCSGFTQMVYRLCGFSLPRDAYQQAELGQTLSFIEESEIGDLAFFDNAEGRITHVGIILSDHKILHASGKVRIDQLDQTGIFNPENGKHTHKLRVIKKIM